MLPMDSQLFRVETAGKVGPLQLSIGLAARQDLCDYLLACGLDKDKLADENYDCVRRHNCLKATLHPRQFVPNKQQQSQKKLSEQNKWHVNEIYLSFTTQSGVAFCV